MRAYFEKFTAKGDLSNINFYTAYEGFQYMGFHIIMIDDFKQVPADDNECVTIGSIQFITSVLQHIDKQCPVAIDYPDCLHQYLGRKLWTSTINEIDADVEQWNVFVKPKGFTKKFTGRVIRTLSDLRGTGDQLMNTLVWVSEPVEFIREWRVFVRYRNILDVRPYKGNWKANYNAEIIESAVKDFVTAPAGYAMDFGVTKDGRTLLVEVNDGFSIGSYGLFFTDYCKLLSARWAELTEQNDLCAFDM